MAVPQEPNRPRPGSGAALDRRRFLVGGSAAAAALLAACSGGDGDTATPSGRSSGSTAPSTPATNPTATTATTAPATTTVADASGAAAALAAVGSPGLMDEPTYQRRIDDYLALATADAGPGVATNPTAINARLIRAARDPEFAWDIGAVTVESLADSFARIDNWDDTRDFTLMYLLWMLTLGRGDTATTRLSPEVISAIGDRFVANRYRYDDPLPADRIDNLWFWSENHRIINLTLEYLAGARFADDTFTVTGLTGAEHRRRARADIVEWIGERAELGFFEWHSNVYMLKNITPLLMLAELADDAEIVVAAAMALDLCLVDMAAHNHSGSYTAPRGRTYKKDKMSSLDEDTFGTAKFVFDDTTFEYPSASDNGATYLCAATRYRPPQLVVDIATDDQASVVRERHGVYFDGSSPLTDHPDAPYGRDFSDPANIPFWWSLGAIGMWPLAETSVAAANDNRLWDTVGFEQINLLAQINDYDPERIRVWEQERAAVINFGFLSEANTYAYREANVSLATVLDHRPGEMRDQVHSWQAAIDENAMVFTNHPVTDTAQTTDWGVDEAPGYWTGEASMPRSAQFERTAVHLYQPKWDESTDPLVWSVFGYRPYTHAYVPQDHFDEIREVGNWVIAAKGDAFIALWSWRTPAWRTYDPAVVATDGLILPFDLVAEGGPDNVWLVEVGSGTGGNLDMFVAAITSIDPSVVRDDSGFTFSWTSPSAGVIDFSTTGPFMVEGVEQPLGDHPRHQSPWGIVDHLATRYELQSRSALWTADFGSGVRDVSAATGGG